MHTVEDIYGRGRWILAVGTHVINVETLLHPAGGYVAYSDINISRSIPSGDLRAVAACLVALADRLDVLNGVSVEIEGTAV